MSRSDYNRKLIMTPRLVPPMILLSLKLENGVAAFLICFEIRGLKYEKNSKKN